MTWYIRQDGRPQRISEEVLIDKIKNQEFDSEILVVNEILEVWTPLQQTNIWKENCPVQPPNGAFVPPPIPVQADNTESPIIQATEQIADIPKTKSSKTGKRWGRTFAIFVVVVGVAGVLAIAASNMHTAKKDGQTLAENAYDQPTPTFSDDLAENADYEPTFTPFDDEESAEPPANEEVPIQVYYSGEEPSGLQFVAELDDPGFSSLGHMQVTLATSAPLHDLRIVGLDLTDDYNYTVSHTAYDIGELLPGQAISIGVPVGEYTSVWGFVYTDAEGVSHAFSAYEEIGGLGYDDFWEIHGRAPGIGIVENVRNDAPNDIPSKAPNPAPEGPTASGQTLPYLIWTTEEVPIYAGPGTDYAYSKSMTPGVYTIVEESTGQGAILWGKLKSGAGWIALDHIRLQDGSNVLKAT